MQLTQIVGPGGEKYHYSYDANGNLTAIRDPLGHHDTFTYDPTFNQLTSFTDARGNGMDYGYDAHGNLTSITYADGSQRDVHLRRHGNVLTGDQPPRPEVAYTYNAAGQVTSKDDLTTPGIDFVYTYDTAGNLTSATDPTGTTTMTYDPATDLLTRIDYPGGHFFTFAYDAAAGAPADRPGPATSRTTSTTPSAGSTR